MLKEEFIARTGYTPTDAEYAAVEKDYYDFDGDKDDFCKAFDVKHFKAAQEARKNEAMRKENADMKEELAAMREANEKMAAEIAELKKRLEEEQAWKPYDKGGTRMEEEAYESLARCGHVMTEDEAKSMMHRACGFDPSMIEIVSEASRLEVNRNLQIRTAETFQRKPRYESSDWNYIRFNVKTPSGAWSFEYIDGTLYEYVE